MCWTCTGKCVWYSESQVTAISNSSMKSQILRKSLGFVTVWVRKIKIDVCDIVHKISIALGMWTEKLWFI